MNMVETIKAGESETTEFKTSLAEGGCGSLPVPLTIPLCTVTPASISIKTAPSPTIFCMCACCAGRGAAVSAGCF
ncbi:MAG: hypothetical protein Q8N79_05720 [Candidatus Methanoperedens sp.]|nr:hypothetical protein [Candidatus Methanoperedens sp.]